MHQYQHKKQMFDIQEDHLDEERDKLNFKFSSFLNSFMIDIFLFVAALISILVTLVVIYVVCSHSKLKTLVANITLQHLKGTKATNPRFQDVYCTCKMQWYMLAMLLLILLGIIFIVTSKVRKSNLFRGHLFSNITKVMLFISDTQSYVPVNLCKVAGSIHLFKITGRLTPDCVGFKKNCIWDVLEIDWREVRVTLNGNEINLPTSVVIPFRNKFRARKCIRKQPQLLHVMLKQ